MESGTSPTDWKHTAVQLKIHNPLHEAANDRNESKLGFLSVLGGSGRALANDTIWKYARRQKSWKETKEWTLLAKPILAPLGDLPQTEGQNGQAVSRTASIHRAANQKIADSHSVHRWLSHSLMTSQSGVSLLSKVQPHTHTHTRTHTQTTSAACKRCKGIPSLNNIIQPHHVCGNWSHLLESGMPLVWQPDDACRRSHGSVNLPLKQKWKVEWESLIDWQYVDGQPCRFLSII